MVRIRLRRTGLKAQTSYRIVVADKEAPRDGKFLEIVGSYNPRTNPSTIIVKEDRVFDWLQKGAQPSESVVKIFTTIGLMERWTRVKGGEAVEAVLADSKTSADGRVISPKTHVDTPVKKS